jgi:hypothetical protein
MHASLSFSKDFLTAIIEIFHQNRWYSMREDRGGVSTSIEGMKENGVISLKRE